MSAELIIEMGRGRDRRRREHFLDGRIEVQSSQGLHASEALLLDHLPASLTGPLLVIGGREGLLAEALAHLYPDCEVSDFHDDAWMAELAESRLLKVGSRARVVLAADPPIPEPGYAAILLSCSARGDSNLTSERIRFAHEALRSKGLLRASVDAPRDRFVHERIRRSFGDASLEKDARGQHLVARRRRPRKEREAKLVSFEVKEGEEQLSFFSRPGVFCAGRLDDGSRALLTEMDPREGERVVDIGCGVGVIGICAARRVQLDELHLFDANARALDLAKRNARALLDGSVPVVTQLGAHPDLDLPQEHFDLALANPPYFSDYRIQEVFLRAARRCLKPSGGLQLVTKQDDWYEEHLPQHFSRVTLRERGGYRIYCCERPVQTQRPSSLL